MGFAKSCWVKLVGNFSLPFVKKSLLKKPQNIFMKKLITILILISLMSCEEIINEQNITTGTLNLLAPTENVVLKTGAIITFNWETLNGASDYQLQIAEPNFSNATQLIRDTLIQRADFSIDSLKTSHYEWRVKALNSAYETGYTTNGFVVEGAE